MRGFYYALFDLINVPLHFYHYVVGAGVFTAIYIALFISLNQFSMKFRSCATEKQVHIVLQSVKFANKIIICFITGGSVLFWDTRLLLPNWGNYRDIFYNLASMFAWSDIVALCVNRSAMTFLCKLHHTGVVIAYAYVITSNELGNGLFRALIMYGVFAATAFFHNIYSVIKNMVVLSQDTDILMNKISHFGMMLSNMINWVWQAYYLVFLTVIYYNSGELTTKFPALFFYFLMLGVFIKETDDTDIPS